MCLTTEHQTTRQKLIELQGDIDEPIIIVGDVNTSLSERDPSGKKSVMTEVTSTTSSIN